MIKIWWAEKSGGSGARVMIPVTGRGPPPPPPPHQVVCSGLWLKYAGICLNSEIFYLFAYFLKQIGNFVFIVTERQLRLKLSDPNKASSSPLAPSAPQTWPGRSWYHVSLGSPSLYYALCVTQTLMFLRPGMALLALSHFGTKQVGTQLPGLVTSRATNKDSVEALLVKNFKGFKALVVIVRLEQVCNI